MERPNSDRTGKLSAGVVLGFKDRTNKRNNSDEVAKSIASNLVFKWYLFLPERMKVKVDHGEFELIA